MSFPVLALPPEQLRELAEMIIDGLRNTVPEPPASYSVEEVAEKLGCSTRTIKRRVAAKKYKRIPHLHEIRISHQELTRILS